jgi:hypothetical protein
MAAFHLSSVSVLYSSIAMCTKTKLAYLVGQTGQSSDYTSRSAVSQPNCFVFSFFPTDDFFIYMTINLVDLFFAYFFALCVVYVCNNMKH